MELDKVQGNFDKEYWKVRWYVESDQVWGILIRRIGIYKGVGQIRFRGIVTCGGDCIRFRGKWSRMIVRYGSVNFWVRCRGNSCSMIGMNSSCCRNKCRGSISSGVCCNRYRVNRIIRIVRDASGMIGRDSSSCFHCQ